MTTVTERAGAARLSGLKRHFGAPKVKIRETRRRSSTRVWFQRAGLFGVLLGLLATLMVAFALTASAQNDKDNYSFYKLGNNVGAYFAEAEAPDNEEGMTTNWKAVATKPGNAGSFLGFSSSSEQNSWLASMLSGSSSMLNYSALSPDGIRVQGDTLSDSGSRSGLQDYAYFGATLTSLGIDSTSGSMGFGGALRLLAGGTVLLLFILSGSVDIIFFVFIFLLKWLNPFAWFSEGVNAATGGNTGAGSVWGPFAGISGWIKDWYVALYDLGWMVMAPLFVSFFVVWLLLFRKAGQTGGKFKRLLIRLTFMAVGLPIIGGLYTGTLNSISDDSQNIGSIGASQVVLSTYVDFGRWATDQHLAVPGCATLGWDTKGETASAASRNNVQQTSLCINSTLKGYESLSSLTQNMTAGNGTSPWDQNAVQAEIQQPGVRALGSTMAPTFVLMLKYMAGDQTTAASFESGVKSNLSAYVSAHPDEGATVKKWFIDDYGSSDLSKRNPTQDNPVLVTGSNGLVASANGDVVNFSTPSNPNEGKENGYSTVDSNGNPNSVNLSPMSVYNYLNTSFGPSSMTMYSSEKSSSGVIREQHNSVNQVGSGLTAVLYWFNCVVMLFCFIVIGWAYAFGMLIGSLRRGIQTVSSIPFATLGAVPAIAKVLIYAVAMIVEIIATFFVYRLVVQIFMSLNQIVTSPLEAFMRYFASDQTSLIYQIATGGWLVVIMLVISTVLMIWFTLMALKLRKSFIQGINEMVTKTVEKFTESQVVSPGGSGMGKQLLAAGAAGAASAGGMVAANKVMGGSGAPSIPNRGGPGKLTAANMGGTNGPGDAAGLTAGPDGDGPNPGAGGLLSIGGSSSSEDTTVEGDEAAVGAAGGSGGDAAESPDRGVAINGDQGSPLMSGVAGSGESQIGEADTHDRDIAQSVHSRGGLSTDDDPAQKPVMPVGGTVGAAMDPNKGVRESDAIAKENSEANKDALKGGAKAVAGGAVAAAGAATGNAKMAQEGGKAALDGASKAAAAKGRKDAAASSPAAVQAAAADRAAKSGARRTASSDKPDGTKTRTLPGKAAALSQPGVSQKVSGGTGVPRQRPQGAPARPSSQQTRVAPKVSQQTNVANRASVQQSATTHVGVGTRSSAPGRVANATRQAVRRVTQDPKVQQAVSDAVVRTAADVAARRVSEPRKDRRN